MVWTDNAQLEFLTNLVSKYYEAKKAGTADVEAFYQKTFDDFCLRWPADDAKFNRADIYKGTPEEVSRNKALALQSRLREWYKYHTRPKQTRAALSVLSLAGGKNDKRPGRMLHAIEAYNRLYIKDDAERSKALDAAFEVHRKEMPGYGLQPLSKMRYMRVWLTEQLSLEPQTVKTHVDLFRKTRVVDESIPGEGDLSEDATEDELDAAERQRLVKVAEIQKKTDVLSATLKTIGNELEEQLGAKGFFFVALPEPKAAGKLSVFKCSFGLTADDKKQDFESFHPEFESQVQTVASKAVRQQFSLVPKRQVTCEGTPDTVAPKDDSDVDLDEDGLQIIDSLDDDSEIADFADPADPTERSVKSSKKKKTHSGPRLTPYEQEREKRIKENEELMKELGIGGPNGAMSLLQTKPVQTKPKRKPKANNTSVEDSAANPVLRRSTRNQINAQGVASSREDHSAGTSLTGDEADSDEPQTTDMDDLVAGTPLSSEPARVSTTASCRPDAPVVSNGLSGELGALSVSMEAATVSEDLPAFRGVSTSTPTVNGEPAAPANSSDKSVASSPSSSVASVTFPAPVAAAATAVAAAAAATASDGAGAASAASPASTTGLVELVVSEPLVFDPAYIKDPRQRKAYSWIPEAEAFLRRHLRGDMGDAVIKHWIDKYTQDSSKRISKQGRPKAVDDWLKRARNYNKLPEVPPAIEYSAVWELWYKNLQPPGPRRSSDTFPLPQGDPDTDADWSNLKTGGANGFFIVLMTLAFWTVGVQTEADTDRYKSAVGDVLWVLRSMLAGMSAQKRKVSGSDSADGGSMDSGSRRTKRRK
ncbi:hypothetical protein DFH11DRAFT_1735400 [Phellopilus nigrolimitatus]|nr:hypothetical protein DFH11DRAFT_1735400 [Phellopilus nigrolimitatus]